MSVGRVVLRATAVIGFDYGWHGGGHGHYWLGGRWYGGRYYSGGYWYGGSYWWLGYPFAPGYNDYDY
ncbi:MAG TPA: hypothetical protein VE641_19260 [Chthoniobacterales bacterium]|nr:hypothetical protein [Chthoniobacterales bacterium]